MSEEFKYRAFISYSHRDEKWAKWVHRSTEAYRVPPRLVGRETADGRVPRRLYPVFRDRDELPSSSSLSANITETLRQSRYLIVICSPHAARSRWVDEEIRTFKSLGREDRVLCLIVAGEPHAAEGAPETEAECFPPSIRFRVDSQRNLTAEPAEPIAADVRPGKDGTADARLKLLAGLLHVGFDELKQREQQRERSARRAGAAAAALLTAALLLPDFGPVPPLRLNTFDTYQMLFPRVRKSAPVTIVEIDDASLKRVGQWPWSRDVVARLVDRIAARRPAVIAFGVFFSEPDRSSPEAVADSIRARAPRLAEELVKLKPNDEILAEAMRRTPVVLGIAAIDDAGPESNTAKRAVDALGTLVRFPGALRSLPRLSDAAAGHGLLNAPVDDGVMRRIPLVAQVEGEPVLTLMLESVRVAAKLKDYQLVTRSGTLTVRLGDLDVPAQPDGHAWLHYSGSDETRFVSAADVMDGRDPPSMLDGRIALVGVTAVTLAGSQTTSLRQRQTAVEIHAQVAENLWDNAWLRRPTWARYVEALAFLIAAVLITTRVSRMKPRYAVAVPLACVVVILAAGVAAFKGAQMLFDASTLVLAVAIQFMFVMAWGYFASGAAHRAD